MTAPSLLRPAVAALLAVLALCLPASSGAGRAARPAHLLAYGPWHPACRGKPMPGIGNVTARVLDRPAADRAVIVADWCSGAVGEGCCLCVVLPEGAFLVEGEEEVHLAPGATRASVTWQVQFLTGAPSDLVVRLCATAPDGPCSCETAIRLTD